MGLLTRLFSRKPQVEPPPLVAADSAAEYADWWREAVNSGRLFRITKHRQYFRPNYLSQSVGIHPVEDSGDGLPFREIAEYLYRNCLGAILCPISWTEVRHDDPNCLFLSYGDIVDFLLIGKLIQRERGTLGWGPHIDAKDIICCDPGPDILLPRQRFYLACLLRMRGIDNPKVALLIDRLGNKSLVFNLHDYWALKIRNESIKFGKTIDGLLPGYYFQGVYTDDGDVATFPLLRADAILVENDEADVKRGMREETYRAISYGEEGYDHNLTSSPGELRWRERILLPETRFHFSAPEGEFPEEPEIVLHIAAPGEDGFSFLDVARRVMEQMRGLQLCSNVWPPREDASPEEIDAHYLTLSLGEVADFVMTGEFKRRHFASDGWMPPMESLLGEFSEPDLSLLPMPLRLAILHGLRSFDILAPTVSLQTFKNGQRLLYFSGSEIIGQDAYWLAPVNGFLQWCLPRHYTFVMVEYGARVPWPLIPSHSLTSPESIAFDTGDDE